MSASTIGAIIEGYDLIIFGVYSALIFPTLFFPGSDPATGILLAFGTYFVGFLARPIGGIVFGHLGDRIGRKPIMLVTLVMVAIGTVGAGALPVYEQVGIWAPVLLLLCRVVQGVGFGGEWGGATLLSMESGRAARAALLAAFPQSGAMWGLALANFAVLMLQVRLAPDVLFDWGWRIPLLASAVLLLVGLYLRLKVEETPVFERAMSAHALVRRPLVEVVRNQPVTLVSAILVKAGSSVSVFIFTSFVLSYAPTKEISSAGVLAAVMIAAVLGGIATPFAGLLADRFGAYLIWRIGAISISVVTVAFFVAIESGAGAPSLVLLALALLPYSLMFGPEASMISRTFDPVWRYSGSSLAFNFGNVVGGGLAPVLAQTLVVTTGSGFAVAVYLVGAAAVGFVATFVLQRSAARGTGFHAAEAAAEPADAIAVARTDATSVEAEIR
ncbi:MFS transporter [Agromyces sp. LHK192]|uniref:MFS transporter n=1 Tax=Agromyces sp. LHK192 TaxID=2498704 RepID=UPI0013E2D5BF|nr:MFS transporter [Agromyces sp. LHK192]